MPNDPYNPSAVLTVDDIVEMDIAKNDHVYAWYRNGMHSEGSSGNLARYAIGPYIKARILYNWWGPPALKVLPPGARLTGSIAHQAPSGFVEPKPLHPVGAAAQAAPGTTGPAGAATQTVPPGAQLANDARAMAAVPVPGLPHSVVIDAPGETNVRESLPRSALKVSPGPITPYDGSGGPTIWGGPHSVMINGGDYDPMVAVSDKFMLLTGAASIFFADRLGNALSGMPTAAIPIADFFSAFTDPSPTNEIRLDRNVGFTGACDGPGIPNPTEGHSSQALDGYCVSDFYDARAYFDAASKRFFVVVHAANNIQVDFTGNFSGAQPGACGCYRIPPNNTKALLFKDDCLWSRFLIAIAVSKTDDPRDGFHQYVMTQNMDADFPWLAVNGNRVVVNHKGPVLEPPQWPSKMPLVQVLDLNGVASGAHHPAFFTYYPNDLGGRVSISTPVHHGDTQGVTYLIAGSGQASTLTIFGIPDSPDPWTAPTPMQVTETLNYDPPASFGSVYRGGKLYFASSRQEDSSSSGVMNSIRVTRIPITRNGNSLSTSTSSSDGFLDYTFGTKNANEDGPNDKFSYDDPSMDVNASGAMLIGYHRGPFQGKALFPEARVTFWPAGAAQPHPSRLVRAGGNNGSITVHYDTTVVDPADDNTFWVALPFVDNSGSQATTISYIP